MTDNDTPVSRRSYLKLTGLAGTAGVTALAGCSQGSDGDDGGNQSGNDSGNQSGGGDGDGGSGNQELEIVHWWTAGGEQDALNALLEGFQEEYPDASVNNNPAPGGAGSALDTVIRNRVLNENPPSTFQIWPGQALTPYTESDMLEDISDIWSGDMEDAYLQGVRDAAQSDGSYVAVPINIHRLNNLFYNVSVVEEAGVDMQSVDSPQALLDAMETISNNTDAVPMAHQTQSPWSSLQLWEAIFQAEQGIDAYLDFTQGNVSNHEQGVKDALSRLSSYSDHFNEDAGSITWDQGNSKVINGDAAMIHQGDWAAGQYDGADDFNYGEQWEHVPFPGTSGLYAVVTDSFVMPTNNPSPETTRQFLTYCGSVDAQERFNPIKGSIPPRTDVPNEPFGPFLQQQRQDFENSDAQPPTIAHGTAVSPDVKSSLEEAFAAFNENWDVDGAYDRIANSF
ncbi:MULTISPECIES: ABC transporter substrate-binding protein [Haloprofundus]|uniref:ABC transporter substrate-binding protein n=1 Tax=Haloprofundus TaxID=1911573 RepID=UPI000E435953|nr:MULTISPECIES: ABC transporter substrate-binding protein [Haloprofundus]QCJ46652.1 carbohydrate ABC transporter substrate-binding protein [Haloprofundus sp. MHR1]